MAKRNKKIKQRKKRQLRKVLKQVAKNKEVTPATEAKEVTKYPEWILPKPINTEAKHKDKDKAFQKELDKVYNGTVTALTHYVNDSCSMTFKCNDCGLIFFGKAGHIISDKEHQRHVCGMPYSTIYGERYASVSAVKPNIKTKGGKKQAKKQAELFDQLIWQDYSYKEIAKELQVNPKMVKDYFISEGLIEE